MATMEKLEGSKVKLTIEIAADEFEKAVQEAYLKTRKKYSVPGFRKGHAPRKVIENAYGWIVFFDDAFDLVYPNAYEAAVQSMESRPWTGRMFPSYPLNRAHPSFSRRKWL